MERVSRLAAWRRLSPRFPLCCVILLSCFLSAPAARAGTGPASASGVGNPAHLRDDLKHATRSAAFSGSVQETTWVGHTSGTPSSGPPWYMGRGPARPGGNSDGVWDWDHLHSGLLDSLQGWWPVLRDYGNIASPSVSDVQRPWTALDYGNQANQRPVQGRTPGVVGVWHVDGGNNVPGGVWSGGVLRGPLTWAPLSGAASAWCGLRAAGDNCYLDPVAGGGTGNPFNQEVLRLHGEDPIAGQTEKNFPGYASQWDQMLYRDVRVAGGATMVISFKYQAYMSTSRDVGAATGAGWFDKDPLTLEAGNFISATVGGSSAPRDSFMVYVGVPADPAACQHSDHAVRPIFDLKRRWFSEVLRIDAPYWEILSTAGRDSTHKTTPFTCTVPQYVLQQMLLAQGAPDGGGVIRVVFRVKTNKDYADDDTGVTGYSSGTQGAVRIDDVSIAGGVPAISSGFEVPGEIDNTIEAPNSGLPGPSVGPGYALGHWHATGRPLSGSAHAHPLGGGDIGGGNYYAPLQWNDLYGPPGSPDRQCNMEGVVVSMGDHDRGEILWDGITAQRKEAIVSPSINLRVPPFPGQNEIGLDLEDREARDYCVRYDLHAGILGGLTNGHDWTVGVQCWPGEQANGVPCWGEPRFLPYQLHLSPVQCITDVQSLFKYGLVRTSNPDGYPDSIRVLLSVEKRCLEFGLPLDCLSGEGAYFDNVSVGFISGPEPPRPALSFAFKQLSYHWGDPDSGAVDDSDIGALTVTFQPRGQYFLNVAGRRPGAHVPVCIVQNLLLPDSLLGAPLESLTAQFDLSALGVTVGQRVDSLAWGWTLDAVPLLDVELDTWLSGVEWQPDAPVGRSRLSFGNGVPTRAPGLLPLVPSAPEQPFLPPARSEIFCFPGCNMKNLDLNSRESPGDDPDDWNGCMPASCANSLKWLDEVHPEIFIPPSLRETFNQMSAMGGRVRDSTGVLGGVSLADAARAKLDFIEAYGLPIRVKYQSARDSNAITSTTGLSRAECRNPDPLHPAPPTLDWLLAEARAGEDVEIELIFRYQESDGSWVSWGHEVTLSGAWKAGGKPYVTVKDDARQDSLGGLRQVRGGVTTETFGTSTYLRLPGLETPVTLKDGTTVVKRSAYVVSVLSESYDRTVTRPPSSHTFTRYCMFLKRIIPPGQKLVLHYPDQARCLNTTVYVYDPLSLYTTSNMVKPTVWNFNRNETRQVLNTTSAPIMVCVHNDDHMLAPPYVPFTVDLEIVPYGPGEVTSPSNEQAYGGFSLGGSDSTCREFGSLRDTLVVVEDSLGMSLGVVPGSMGAGGTSHLVLRHAIGAWNDFWEHLGLRLGVAAVTEPGQLIVQCPSTGRDTTLAISGAGEYVVDLGTMSPAPGFELSLRTTGGLRLALDCIGVPSLVPLSTSGVTPGVQPPEFSLGRPRPNPSRGSTEIGFALPRSGRVSLAVYDVGGRRVRTLVNGTLPSGERVASWDGRDEGGRPVSSGLYLVRLEAVGRTLSRRLVILH